MFGRDSGILGLFASAMPSEVFAQGTGELPASLELGFEGYGEDKPTPFETEGSVQETPSRYLSSGGLRIEREMKKSLHELRFVEKEKGGYAVEGSHLRPVDERIVTFVSSRETLKEFASSGISSLSKRLGAEVDVNVMNHSVGREELEDSRLVNVEYEVSLEGLGTALRTDSGDLSVEEAAV